MYALAIWKEMYFWEEEFEVGFPFLHYTFNYDISGFYGEHELCLYQKKQYLKISSQ